MDRIIFYETSFCFLIVYPLIKSIFILPFYVCMIVYNNMRKAAF